MLNGAEGIRQKQKDQRNDGAQRRLKIRYSKEKTPKRLNEKRRKAALRPFQYSPSREEERTEKTGRIKGWLEKNERMETELRPIENGLKDGTPP